MPCSQSTCNQASRLKGELSCNACWRAELLDAQIAEMREMLARLLVRRRESDTDLNHSHSAMLALLPAEIISYVFQLCIPEFHIPSETGYIPSERKRDTQDFIPFVLGSVCRTWRAITWSTPQIWTSITLSLDLDDKFAGRGELACRWLERSGQLPLSIRIHSDPDCEDEAGAKVFYPIIKAINQCSNRWRHLHLFIPPFMLPYFHGFGRGAPMLRELWVGTGYLSDDTTSTFKLHHTVKPRLSHVSIIRLRLWAINIFWNHVSWVEAHGLYVDECVELIRRAPRLRYCKLDDVCVTSDWFRLPAAPVVNEKLRKLDFASYDDSADEFFAHVTLPHLKYFSCELPEGVNDSRNLVSFFSRSSCPLGEIAFVKTSLYDEELLQILKVTPTIYNLHLSPLPRDRGYFTVTPLLKLLAKNPLLLHDDDADDDLFLPQLEELMFHLVEEFPWKYLLDAFGPLAELDNLQRRPLGYMHVGFSREEGRRRTPYDYIHRDMLPGILKLNSTGLAVEVRHFDDDVDMIELSMKHHGMDLKDA